MGISKHTVRRMMQDESPDPSPTFQLLDEAGQPLSATTQAVFLRLEQRFREHFPTLNDPAVVRNLFDRAGQQYARMLGNGEQVEKPEALAWKILRNLGTSELRRSEQRVSNGTVHGDAVDRLLENRVSEYGTPQQSFAIVHASEILAQLNATERKCITLKSVGWTSVEVGKELQMTAAAVDKMMQRIRDRCRGRFLGTPNPPKGGASS